jgi:DNA repair and recombination protein RAD52
MSGALSGHLLDAYNPHTIRNHDGVPGQWISAPQIPFTTSGSQFQSISEETAKKIASLQAKLDRKLGPEYISQRPGPGGGPKLTYVEGWKVINLANEVFGFNGWSSSIVNLSTDFTDYLEETKRYCIGVSAVVRVTLRDGVFHEDVGYGMVENTKSKGAGLDKVRCYNCFGSNRWIERRP